MKPYLLCLYFAIQLLGLRAQDQPEVVITQGHIDNVTALDFSPDHKYIATGSKDRSIRIWYRALQQEYRVLYGHRKGVAQVRFSLDGTKLISIDGMDLIVWEVLSGKLLHKLEVNSSSRSFSLLPDQPNEILLSRNSDKIIYDIEKGAVVETLKFGIGSMGWSAHPRLPYFLLCEKTDSIMVYDRTGKRVNTLIGEGFYQHLAISPNGNKVAGFSITGQVISIWDFKSGQLLSSIKTDPQKPINRMLFNGEENELWTMGWTAEVNIYDLKTGTLKKVINQTKLGPEAVANGQIRAGIGLDMALSPDNKIVGVALTLINSNQKTGKGEDIRGVLLFDAYTGQEMGMLRGYFKWINHLSVGPEERYMVSSNFGKNRGLRLWSIKEAAVDRYIRASGYSAASADGRITAFTEYFERKAPKLRVYRFPSFKKLADFDVSNSSALCLNSDGSRLAALRVDQNLQNPLNHRFYISVWDLKTKELYREFDINSKDAPFFWAFKMSPDGDYIISESAFGVGVWEVESGQKINLSLKDADYEHLLDVHPSDPIFTVAQTKLEYVEELQKVDASMHILSVNYKTGKIIHDLNTQKEGVLLSGDFSPDGNYLVTGQTGYMDVVDFDVVIWDWNNKTESCRLKGHNGGVKQVQFGHKSKRVYSAAEDGIIKIWDINQCQIAASMIGMNDLDYIILSPENYYKSSKGNTHGLGFRFQQSLYTFDQFDLRFNRPDKVLEALGASPYRIKIYTKAWEKRLQKMGYTAEMLESDLMLPEIKLLNRDQIPFSTNHPKLQLEILAKDNNAPLDRIKVLINDVPYPSAQGISLRKKRGNTVKKDMTLPLSQGKNLVKISVMNKHGLESIRESFDIEYQAKKSQPDLYLFTIGVAEFSDTSRNLQFAKKDAEDLIAQLRKTSRYNRVNVQSFYNEKALKKEILKGSRFLEKAKIDDQVIIYISTHGLLDDSLNYYLALHDSDFNHPAKQALPYESINHFLDGIDCRNRLVLIDACHSGEVDKSEGLVRSKNLANNIRQNSKSGTQDIIRPKTGLRNSFTYMQELFTNLSESHGATIISAASGYEFALESEDWNNGVFTYAIIEGLKSRAADLDKNGKVYISELKNYVAEKVRKLTNGQQHPNTRNQNNLNDFIIYEY